MGWGRGRGRHRGIRRLVVVAMVGAGLVALPPRVAVADSTSTSFTLTAGVLAISVPGSANLGSAAVTSTTFQGSLGTVTVTDERGAAVGSWTATVSATDFTTGGASAAETVAKGQLEYWSGPATATTGTGTFTPGQLLATNRVTLGVARTAFTAAATVGNTTVSWAPTVVVNVPSGVVAGTYTGTVTHSVA